MKDRPLSDKPKPWHADIRFRIGNYVTPSESPAVILNLCTTNGTWTAEALERQYKGVEASYHAMKHELGQMGLHQAGNGIYIANMVCISGHGISSMHLEDCCNRLDEALSQVPALQTTPIHCRRQEDKNQPWELTESAFLFSFPKRLVYVYDATEADYQMAQPKVRTVNTKIVGGPKAPKEYQGT